MQLLVYMSNDKGALQELLQRDGLQVPTYRTRSTGPPHCPITESTVTVRYRNSVYRETVECRGIKKKDAEKLAAKKMLQRLQNGSRAAASTSPGESSNSDSYRAANGAWISRRTPSPGPSLRSVHVSRSVRSASLSPAPQLASPSPPPPSSYGGRSPVSVLQERLQAMNFPLPEYLEEGRSPTMFRARCVVAGELSAAGDGHSKKTAKEAAARNMLREIEEGGGGVNGSRNVLREIEEERDSSSPDPMDEEMDVDITAKLAPYSPQYHYWRCQFGEVFCLAWVDTREGVPHPIAGHGRGENRTVAQRAASLNLYTSLGILTT